MQPEWLDITIFGVAQFFMLVGLFGLIVPLYPGTVIMWLAALGYGVAAGFGRLGFILFILLTLIMIASTLVDNLFMGAGARKEGASWWTILAALVAGVLGTLLFPPLGGLVAAPGAVLLLEYNRTRDWQRAWRSLRGLATGWGLAFIVRFGMGMVMMLMWWAWVVWGN